MSSQSRNLLECVDVHYAPVDRGLRPGRWYKPSTAVVKHPSGEQRMVKGYPSVFPLAPYFRLLAGHEYRMLQRVDGLAFTPGRASRCKESPGTLAYDFVEGARLKDQSRDGGIPEDFFIRLYAAVQQLHRRGVIHFDLGNSGNVLCSVSGEPRIIDFGSAVPMYLLPRTVADWGRGKDLMGVLKLWYRFDRESMPEPTLKYFLANYRKNIYTPRRFLKALKRCLANPVQAWRDSTPVAFIVGLFAILLTVSSII
ncbi:hypothetical protein [Marinobacter sp. VGCF2001]|uniref:hypothetical protein n=1 Tax=Marinobacter sp. VGCF2001 TaxID=3417189 RepID=UPI003CE7E1E2